MNLIKIGGAVLKNKSGFEAMVNIIKNHSSMPLIIVISAFSKATSELGKAARLAEKGNEAEAFDILGKVISEHIEYADELLNDTQTLESLKMLFDDSKKKLSDFIRGLNITGELTPRTLDAILSYGEFFALHTVFHYLQEQGFNVYCIDSTNLIVSDAHYGNARPILKETTKLVKEKILPKLQNDSLVLTQGFVAKNKAGEITTMGIESSNLTATLIADILDIDTVTFWTDVSGIRTADPKIVKDTIAIENINYNEAYSAAVNGLKLIHQEMIDLATSKKITMVYKSAFEPNGGKTSISDNGTKNNLPILICLQDLLFVEINISSESMSKELELIINDFKKQSNDIISHSYFPDSVRIIMKNNSKFSGKLIKKFEKSNIISCAMLVILNNAKKIHGILNNEFIEKYQNDIIAVDFSADSIKIITASGNLDEFMNILHKKMF